MELIYDRLASVSEGADDLERKAKCSAATYTRDGLGAGSRRDLVSDRISCLDQERISSLNGTLSVIEHNDGLIELACVDLLTMVRTT